MRINGKKYRSEFECLIAGIRTVMVRNCSRRICELFILFKRRRGSMARAAGLDTTGFSQAQKLIGQICRVTLFWMIRNGWQCPYSISEDEGNVRGGQGEIRQIYKYLPQTITSRHLQENELMDSGFIQVIQNPAGEFARLVDRFSDDKRCRWMKVLRTTSEFESCFLFSKR